MRIAQLRKEKHYSQMQLAQLLNVSQSTISAYEIGDRVPDMDTLIKFANLFDVSIDYIAGVSDTRKLLSKSDLSPQEMEHVSLYRKLDHHQQDKVDGFMMSFLFNSDSPH